MNCLTHNKINKISFVFTKMAVFLLAVCLHLAVGLGKGIPRGSVYWRLAADVGSPHEFCFESVEK